MYRYAEKAPGYTDRLFSSHPPQVSERVTYQDADVPKYRLSWLVQDATNLVLKVLRRDQRVQES